MRKAAWSVEEGWLGPRLVLNAGWSDAAARAWRAVGARELEINYAKGWQGEDVRFLEDLPGLLGLTIIDWRLEDSSVINALESLRYLKLFTHCGTAIDFDGLPQLRACSLEWRRGARSLFRHPGVRMLFVNRLDAGGDLRPLQGMRSLRVLERVRG